MMNSDPQLQYNHQDSGGSAGMSDEELAANNNTTTTTPNVYTIDDQEDAANYTVEDNDWGNDTGPPDEGAVYMDDGSHNPGNPFNVATNNDNTSNNMMMDPIDPYQQQQQQPAIVPDGGIAIINVDEDPAELYHGDEPQEFDDPYADSPYPTNDDPYEHTPYAADKNYVHDPYGELDYSENNGAAADLDDLDDINLSRKENVENIQGGEYELESKDPKFSGVASFLQRYGKSLLACSFMLCMSLVIMGIVLVATIDSGSYNSPETSPWGLRHDAVHTGGFVPPPLALETTCTQENIATQQGFDACAKLCDPAQCCRFDPVSAPHMSCERGHVQDCHTYHHYCEHPPRAAIIPFTAPPENIKDVCTAEKMHTPQGVTACARACEGGTCCRYPSTLSGLSCLRGNEAQCQIYHQYCEQPPSSEGHGTHATVPSTGAGSHPPPSGQVSFPFVKPPDDIQDRCSGKRVATAQGFEECLEICRSGTCCRFDPEREPMLSCRNEQPQDCPIYDQYCGGNTNVISQQSTPPHPSGGTGVSGNNHTSPTYVEDVCSDHSLATVEGFADCQEACSEAECCWKKEFGTTCPVWAHCEPYSHCLAMQASDHIDVAIQVSINLKCTDTQLATEDGRKDCLLACSQATCCFGSSAGDCPHETSTFCQQYEACEKAVRDTIPPPPPALNEKCSRENVRLLGGLAECDRACGHADCCWKTTGPTVSSCSTTNPLCKDYAPCSILEQGSSSSVTFPPVPTAPSTLDNVCTKDILNAQGRGAMAVCEDVCKNALCCWESGACLYEQATQCLGYTSCAVLLSEVPEAPSVLPEVCTMDKISSGAAGIAECKTLCEGASCCWKTGACLDMQADRCQAYQPCSVLQSIDDVGGPIIPTAPEGLPDYCTATAIQGQIAATGVSLCEDFCKPATCCWKTGSCLEAQPEKCEGYTSCGILVQSGTPASAPLPEAESFLKDVCTKDKVVNVEGAILCQDGCKAAECCWKTKTCLQLHSDQCPGYAPCSVLVQSSGTDDEGIPLDTASPGAPTPAPTVYVPDAPTYLNTVCDSEIGGDQVHGHLCVNACKRASCCWEGLPLCTSNPKCAAYSICSVVNFDTIVAPTNAPVAAPATPAPVPAVTQTPGTQTPESTTAPGPVTPETSAPGNTAPGPTPGEYSEEMITDACMNHDNSIVNLCARVCWGSDCCFHADNANGTNCGDFPCYKYSACSVLNPTADDAVNQACNNGELSDCINACGSSWCCFTKDIDKVCAETNPGIVCSRYTACERIYDVDFGG
ncbi:expressed unknown protein [Seminavis robusta]|uniref:Uncharacterized protein n=1 Tax=Seminavis robusta TaxID=568900 RepID=A0A9N8DDU7_9STRA|nr:expressed unknown protein [Seminavis robusta]|eukprot:Sro73_g040230.1 n/a (1273) ;mRNA; f:13082-17471